MSPPASILLIRLSAIGDIVMASGLIPLLRSAFPETRIVWLADEDQAELLRYNPRLDGVMVWPRRRWRKLRAEGRFREFFGELTGLVRELRQARFDWVLDLQGLLKSGIWAALSGGKERIGLGSREGSQCFMTRVIDRHVVSPLLGKEYRKLAQELGLAPSNFSPDIGVPETARIAADALLNPVSDGRPIVAFAPFTTRPQKHWLDGRWLELAHRLVKEQGCLVVLLGGPGDRQHPLCVPHQAPMLDLVGATTLPESAAVIAKAQLLIGVDTGLTHLGIAMKTPTLALFGSTRPYLDAGVDNARVLYHPMICSPCRRRPTCDGEFTCMKAHTVDQVLNEARLLLESAP